MPTAKLPKGPRRGGSADAGDDRTSDDEKGRSLPGNPRKRPQTPVGFGIPIPQQRHDPEPGKKDQGSSSQRRESRRQ